VDLQFLRDLYKLDGPVVSVHLDTSREDQDADQRIEVEWRRLRRDLERQGVDEPTLVALDERLVAAPHVIGPQGEALFAHDGTVAQAHVMADPPAANRAVVLPIADPLGLVIDRDHQVPYVVVAVDRAGSDIDAYAVGEHDPVSQHSFSGGTLHITKVRGGGISSGHYHRRTENVWDRHARESAQAVVEAMESVGAELVLVGGDDKAAALLRDHLDGLARAADVRVISGGRADTGALRALRASVDAAVEDAMRRSHEQVIERFTDALRGSAQSDGASESDAAPASLHEGPAVEGMRAVKEMLAAGRVDVLLLAADRSTDPQLWGSRSDPMIVATDQAGLGAASGAFEAPAAALLLRAAAEGGAQFTELLPGTPVQDGVGALLRY
jgi:hypothetical protein